MEGGPFFTNRKGTPICADFNAATCTATICVRGQILCAVDQAQVHQCSKCLSADHNATQCSKTPGPPPAQPANIGRNLSKQWLKEPPEGPSAEDAQFASVTWKAFLAGCNAANAAPGKVTCTVCSRRIGYPLQEWKPGVTWRNPFRLWQHLAMFQGRFGHPSHTTFQRWEDEQQRSQQQVDQLKEDILSRIAILQSKLGTAH